MAAPLDETKSSTDAERRQFRVSVEKRYAAALKTFERVKPRRIAIRPGIAATSLHHRDTT